MDEQTNVSYIAYESAMARQERTIKRLWIMCILLILCLMGSNTAWIIYENSFEDVVTVDQDIEAEADGGLNIRAIGGDYYGSEGKGTSNSN